MQSFVAENIVKVMEEIAMLKTRLNTAPHVWVAKQKKVSMLLYCNEVLVGEQTNPREQICFSHITSK